MNKLTFWMSFRHNIKGDLRKYDDEYIENICIINLNETVTLWGKPLLILSFFLSGNGERRTNSSTFSTRLERWWLGWRTVDIPFRVSFTFLNFWYTNDNWATPSYRAEVEPQTLPASVLSRKTLLFSRPSHHICQWRLSIRWKWISRLFWFRDTVNNLISNHRKNWTRVIWWFAISDWRTIRHSSETLPFYPLWLFSLYHVMTISSRYTVSDGSHGVPGEVTVIASAPFARVLHSQVSENHSFLLSIRKKWIAGMSGHLYHSGYVWLLTL